MELSFTKKIIFISAQCHLNYCHSKKKKKIFEYLLLLIFTETYFCYIITLCGRYSCHYSYHRKWSQQKNLGQGCLQLLFHILLHLWIFY